MRRTETDELGTIHSAAAGDDLSAVDLGPRVQLRSAHRRSRGVYLGRSWYVQGDRGMLSFEDTGDVALKACMDYLRQAGYQPDEFEEEWAR